MKHTFTRILTFAALLLLLAALFLSACTANTAPDSPDTTDVPGTADSDLLPDGTALPDEGETEAETDPTAVLCADAACAAAYLETAAALQADADGTALSYALINFDGDDTPELVVSHGSAVSLYTYAGGRVYTLMDAWGFGAGGNAGYEYVPGGNVMRNFNSDFVGAVRYETYYRIGEKHRFEPYYDQELYTTLFEDKNGNQVPDSDEPVDENTVHYYYGTNELSAEDYASMQIPGNYEFLTAALTFAELQAALA